MQLLFPAWNHQENVRAQVLKDRADAEEQRRLQELEKEAERLNCKVLKVLGSAISSHKPRTIDKKLKPVVLLEIQLKLKLYPDFEGSHQSAESLLFKNAKRTLERVGFALMCHDNAQFYFFKGGIYYATCEMYKRTNY